MARKNQLMFSDDKITFAEEALLRCFFPEGKNQTLSELKKRSGYSYERVNTNLNSLQKKRILKKEKVGKTLVYTPNLSNIYLKFAFYHYITEKIINFANKHKIIHKAIRGISQDIFGIVLLFGSYSKGNETKNSDIDIMIVSNSEKQVQDKINEIKSQYGLKIAPAFVKRTEFPKIKKENPELWEDIKKYSIIFNGKDYYYHRMYKNE